MVVGGRPLVCYVLLLALCAQAIATEDAGPYTAAPGGVRTVETGAAGIYTVEFDVTAGELRGDRMMVLATFFGKSSNELIGQLGLNVNNGKAIMIGRADYGSTDPSSYPEGYANWGLSDGQTAHVRVTIDANANTIRYEIEGLSPYQTSLGAGTANIAAQGLKAEFGFKRDATGEGGIEEAVPTGWVYRNMVVSGGGEPGSTCTPGTPQEIIADDGFTPSAGQEVKFIGSDLEGPIAAVAVDLDVTAGPWRTDVTCTEASRCEYMLFGLGRPEQQGHDSGYLLGAAVMVKGGAKQIIFFGRNSIGPGHETYNGIKEPFTFQEGTTYHIHVDLDPAAGTSTLTIEGGGQSKTLHDPVPYEPSHLTRLSVELGGETKKPGAPAVSPHGWELSGLAVTATPGEGCDGGTGGTGGTSGGSASLKNAAGYEPNEEGDGAPVELINAAGEFFEQPFDGLCSDGSACESTKTFTIDPAAYEKVTVAFDFTTEDLLREGWFQHLAQLQDACSKQRFWRFLIKQPPAGGGPGQTILDARGNPDWLSGDTPYAEYTTYHAEIVYDLLDQETYVTISDASGAVLQTVGDKLNNDPNNVARIEPTQDGMELVFGIDRSYPTRIYGQPHFWTFSNLIVSAVPLGSGTGGSIPGDADLSSDEGRLAFLAAQLITAADGADYAIDCGPADEVLNLPSDGADGSWCVLSYDDKVAFGSYGETEQAVLEALQDERFAAQVPPEDVNPEGCAGIDTTLEEFQECDAVDGFHTYAYASIDNGVSFVVVSKDVVDGFDTSIWDGILGFFKGLLGIEDTQTVPLPITRFHHGYLAQQGDRIMAAAWLDSEAKFMYRMFVTDFSQYRLPESEYSLGTGSQVVTMDLDPDDESDVRYWRRMTAGLRLADVEGDPIEGDTCGNGILGADEQCEIDTELGSCQELYPLAPENITASCIPPGEPRECTVDAAACLGAQTGACFDTWTEPPSPNFCDPANPDPACRRPGGGGDEGGGGDACAQPDEQCAENSDCCSGECGLPIGATSGTVCLVNNGAPACPTEWTTAYTQGAYKINVRRNSDGLAELMVARSGSMPAGVGDNECYLNGGRDTDHFYFSSTQVYPLDGFRGSEFTSLPDVYRYTLYNREKHNSGSCWDTHIVLINTSDGFAIRGLEDGGSSPIQCGHDDSHIKVDDASAGGTKCWACGSDKDCDALDIAISLADIAPCNPDVTGAPTGTPAGTPPSCTQAGQACTDDAQCCGAAIGRAYCDGTCIRIVGGTPPPAIPPQ